MIRLPKQLNTIIECSLTIPPSEMRVLILSDNALSRLARLPDWAGLDTLDLQRNPWQCDCQAEWLLRTVVASVLLTEADLTAGAAAWHGGLACITVFQSWSVPAPAPWPASV